MSVAAKKFKTYNLILYSGKLSREFELSQIGKSDHFVEVLKSNIGGYSMPKFRGEDFHGWI